MGQHVVIARLLMTVKSSLMTSRGGLQIEALNYLKL